MEFKLEYSPPQDGALNRSTSLDWTQRLVNLLFSIAYLSWWWWAVAAGRNPAPTILEFKLGKHLANSMEAFWHQVKEESIFRSNGIQTRVLATTERRLQPLDQSWLNAMSSQFVVFYCLSIMVMGSSGGSEDSWFCPFGRSSSTSNTKYIISIAC